MFKKIYEFAKDKYVYTLTFLLALLIMLGAWIIGSIGPFGGKCLVVVDGVHQYLPFFSEYQQKLKTLSSLEYSWDVGLGNNFVSLWSYYLSSPFNLLIILCSKSHLPMALNLIITLKIILGCLAFAYFLMHGGRKPVKNPGIIVFSLLYGFSSFIVGYYWNLMWLDSIFIFPIIILGMEKMLIDKDSRMYIFALLYSFVCNYYISFMICIFLVLWFFTFKFKGVADFFGKGIRFAISSLTAAALGAVVLIPAYKGIMTTASAKFSLPKWEYYGSFADTLRSHLFCSEVMTNQIGDGGTNLYCGMITIFLGIIFFFMGDISVFKKIKYALILILMIVSFNNQELNYIWHGFHNQFGIPNRFAFLYIFVLLMMAYEVFLKREWIKPPIVIIAYCISLLFVAVLYFKADYQYVNATYYASALLLTLYMAFLLLHLVNKKYKNVFLYMIVVVGVFEVMINGLVAFKQVGSSEPEYYYGRTKDFVALTEKVSKRDPNFCRSDILEPTFVDEATWYNMKSVGIFGSTVRGELVTLMAKLGFYTGANEYLYYGACPVTNALFNVKYVYTRDSDFINVSNMNSYEVEEGITAFQNKYPLSIGYMVNEDIKKFQFLDNGPFTVLNELCGDMTGYEPVFVSIYDDLQTDIYGTNCNVELTDAYNAKFTNKGDSATAELVYIIPRDMDLYVNCRGTEVHKIALAIDGREVAYDRYQGQIFHVGDLKAGQTVVIQFNFNDSPTVSEGSVYCYPMEFLHDQFEYVYNELDDEKLNVERYTDNSISGTITAKKDGVFMTSIPYDEGWTLRVDGEEVKTEMLLGGLLGADLSKGEHTIDLVYHCPGLLQGFFLTLFGLFILYIIVRIEEMQRDRMIELEEEDNEELDIYDAEEDDISDEADVVSEQELYERDIPDELAEMLEEGEADDAEVTKGGD